jgi:hypothetical protein
MLRKMREVKGLDNTTKRLPIGGGNNLPSTLTGKRKRIDVLGGADEDAEKDSSRSRKVSKNIKEYVALVKAAEPIPEEKPKEPPFVDTEVTMDSLEDGMLDLLRKRLE